MGIIMYGAPDSLPLEFSEIDHRCPRELGMIYATGRNLSRDLVAAHMWFNIAALKGDREAALHRQEIAREMSKDEVAQALAWARAWLDAQAPVHN